MSWILLLGLVLVLSIAFLSTLSRRAELVEMQKRIEQRELSRRYVGKEALLQHPLVDLSRCLGCGTCVAACPEGEVLDLVHGQAVVVNGARCVGHAACERECPVGAITVTVSNLAERRDVPVLSEGLESVSARGLFLAGEVTAHALIKTAIEQGTHVVGEVAARLQQEPAHAGEYELCIVGAGPAGLAAALEAKRLGLSFVVVEQESSPGGTVAQYPRRKLVLTQPVELPLHGPLGGGRTSFTKEELVALWLSIAREEELPIQCGTAYLGSEPSTSGGYVVHTSAGDLAARNVCLAIGRRGSPRKLGVPGEELPKVAYSLLDAHSYQGRRILVVGGGDSAVETALGLAEQPGNEVSLSYRRAGFFRVRERNTQRLEQALKERRLRVLLGSELCAIHPDSVDLELPDGNGRRLVRLPIDEVFVMAGGTAPLELFERSNVTCDPALRPPPPPVVERGTGFLSALGIALGLSVATLSWALWHADYYLLPIEARPAVEKHALLRPGSGLGLVFGLVATLLVGANCLYLARRAGWRWLRAGSLRAWMTSHVATGILALLFATLHGAMDPRDTVGGHALLALGLLLVTGAVGRYFYAYVPRAANGRELELAEVKAELERLGERWDASQRAFVDRVREALGALIHARQWSVSFLGRVRALLVDQRSLRRTLARLSAEGRAQGVPEDKVRATLLLARRAHRTASAVAHYEDLRSVLSSWRYLHRWIAV
ncbi:MAG TPA: NAD(P)-binding domain-containing protein, partial [Myxococcota bacterium]|nr:NAD(P)-binding domain-containing protein [Myxococcota bacterium]